MNKSAAYWSGPDLQSVTLITRPVLIIQYVLRRAFRKKKSPLPGLDAAIRQFAEGTGLSEARVHEIYNGSRPTSLEIDQICQSRGWSIFFLLGVKREAFEQTAYSYFDNLDVQNPSDRHLGEFRKLYEKLLKLVYEEQTTKGGDQNG